MGKAATVLTLICIATVALLAVSWAVLPKEGMEQLALILPWMLMLATHVLLGPVALFLCVRDRRHARHAWIYLYFLIFAGYQAVELVRVTELDHQARDQYEQVVHPEEYALAEALEQAWRQKQLERPPDEQALEKLRELARQAPRVERTFDRHRSPLTHAAGLGDRDLVALMLEKGADVDGTLRDDDAPLLAAAEAGDTAMVKLLLEAGADGSREDYAGENAVLKLLGAELEDGVPELLAAGADPNAGSRRSDARPLDLAVHQGNASVVALLLEAGADPNVHAHGAQDLGVEAASRDDVEVFRLLQAAGLSLQSGKQTLVHRIATDGDIDVLEKLLVAGADPDLPDEYGRSALVLLATDHSGREPGEPERAARAARLLIRHGADVNLRSQHDTTALVLAASRDYRRETCRVLVESGADVNATNGTDRRTALMNAARAGESETVEVLLKAGADPNAASVGLNRTTALVDALRNGDTRSALLLIDAGARVRPPDRYWGDAFRYAAPHPDLVRALVRLGEDIDAKDDLYRFPVEQVLEFGVPESLEVLLAAGPKVRCSRVSSLLDPSRSPPRDPDTLAAMAAVIAGRCPGRGATPAPR